MRTVSARAWVFCGFLACAAIASGVALPCAAWANEVPAQFQYDTGTATQGLSIAGKPLPVGTILASGYRAAHRLTLTSVQVAGWGDPGKLEVHIWRDDGGNQPGAPEGKFANDPDSERMTPQTITIQKNGAWVEVPLAEPVEIAPLDLFWVGVKVVHAGTGPALDGIDQTKTEFTGMVQTPKEVTQCADGCGIPGNLMIRAEGMYPDPIAKTWFTDITDASGIDGFARVAIADYDNDGDDDVLMAGNRLWRNDGHAKFADYTELAGLGGLGGSGGLWGDYNNDGLLDIFVFGGKERLLQQQADHTFVEVHLGEFAESPDRDYPTEAASWVDVDADGQLEVYTANYEVIQKDAAGNDVLGICDWHFLWKLGEDGKWHDVAAAWGLHTQKQCGRGVTAVDWDQDGDQDIYVGNYRLDPNYFWRNDAPDLHMTDIGKLNGTRGVGKAGDFGHTIGSTWADADNDGDFDLFVANLAHPRFIGFSDRSKFYQNLGADADWNFSEHREQTGIGYLETHSNPDFGDFDNDGDLDLTLTAVYAGRKGQLWRNDGTDPDLWLRYSDATYETGWSVDNGWGSAWGDLDGDGDLDQVVNRVFRNEYAEVTGDRGHWLKIHLRGTDKVNAAAIGAWVTVDAGDGKLRSRVVHGGHGLGCQDSLTLHVGLGQATQVASVVVHWPGLAPQSFGPFAVDQTLTIREDTGAEGKAPGDAGADAGAGDAAGDGWSDGDGGVGAPADAGGSGGGCVARGKSGGTAGAWITALAVAFVAVRRRRKTTAPRPSSPATPAPASAKSPRPAL